MPHFTKRYRFILFLGLASIVALVFVGRWLNETKRGGQGAAEPFRIAGNLYYVGATDAAAFLITGPEGHIVLDGGYPTTAPMIIASIAKLGFSIKDVKVLLNSEPHPDHAGGLRVLQQASGAELWASEASAYTLASGGDDPDTMLPLRALVRIGVVGYPAMRVDHRFKDGDTIRLGPLALTAHITAGHTRGCTSWSFQVRDGDRMLNVVSACDLGRLATSQYPGQAADLERSFTVLRALPVDIWVTCHARWWGDIANSSPVLLRRTQWNRSSTMRGTVPTSTRPRRNSVADACISKTNRRLRFDQRTRPGVWRDNRCVYPRAALALSVSALLLAVAFGAPQSKVVALRFGTVVTMTGAPINDAVVVVEGDRIKSVGTGNRAVPADADVIDLRPLTAIPGLIDSHTHMTYFWDGAPGTTPLKQARREPAQTVERAAANARKTLETGVTTVRDLGASGGTDYSMRDLIATGKMIGPRMIVAGQGISAARGGGPAVDAISGLVDTRIKAGSNWIKVYASRGSFQSVDTTQTLNYDQLKAIVAAAHAQKTLVAIHSYGASGVKDAVRAGADSVEHGIALDDETLAMMVKQGTVWVPTIDHNRHYVDSKAEYGFAAEAIPPLNDYIQKNLESTRRAFKAGVSLAMGSDAVYTGFGQNTRELGWFVKAGMTPAQALATATTIPAKMLGREKELGAIAPGYLADIVALEGDPLTDVDVVINKVKWVMAGGRIVKGQTISGAQPGEVSGIAFIDANGNGARDGGERGLANVVVSNQDAVVATDASGVYRLPRGATGVVFVSVPDAYGTVGEIWRRVDDTISTVSFPLSPIARATEFTFIHASDTHLAPAVLARTQRFRELGESLNPAFVIITGDLVKDALRVGETEATGYYELFRREEALFKRPLWTVPGNHEIFGIERDKSHVSTAHPLYGRKMYHHYQGPDYYSFNFGGVHFVGLNTVDIDDQWYYGHVDSLQLAWLERDLAMVPLTMPVVTFNHIPFFSSFEALNGYTDDPPAPTLITVNGKTTFRHTVSNAGAALAILRKHAHVLALGGHTHAGEQIVYEVDGLKTRFNQTPAVVGPTAGAGMQFVSGFTLYTVRNGVIDAGRFLPLGTDKEQ